ncbi:hypothetical protein [Silvibacterium acidisoli]|uniref:hypothetical protein n=1 Tax=Acidobacteriaceae bacterium ZG23-2 TaxID=2883246 RepID=UPI00406C5EEB
MPNNSVTIVVAGEDRSGQVLDVVQKHLEDVRKKAEATDRALSGIGSHMVPQMAAASASVRLLDGDFSHLMRAEERFLSMLPGASALFQAAFPVIGVIAVATGIYKAAEATEQYIQKNREMGRTIQQAWGDANLAYEKSNDELAVTNDKLEVAIAKLEKKPANGLKLALDEAKVSADNLALSLESDNSKLAELMSKNSIGFLGNLATGMRPTKDAEDLFKGYREQVRDITYAGDERARAAKTAEDAQAARTQTQNQLYAAQTQWLDRVNQKLKEVTAQRDEENAELAKHGVSPSGGHDALINDLKGMRTAISSQMDRTDLTNQNESLQKQKDLLEAKKQTADVAEAERKREAEWLTKVQNLGIGPTPQAQQARLKDAAKLQEQMDKQQQESVDQLTESYLKAEETKAQAAVKSSKEEIQALREVQEERIRTASDDMQIAARTADFQMRMGQITAAQRVAAIKQASEIEYQTKLNALEQMRYLDALDPDNPEKVQKDLDQIKELTQRHQEEMLEMDQQEALRKRSIAAGYLHDIFDPLMDRPKSISDAFKKMADNILRDLSRVAEDKMINGVLDSFAFSGGQGKSAPARAAAGQASGIGGFFSGIVGKLTGRGAQKASNGGLASGAGTLADGTTSLLQQGRNATGSGGAPVINIINTGTPQAVQSSGSSGGGLEQQIISIVLKDADSLGPMSRGIGGAISQLGSSS